MRITMLIGLALLALPGIATAQGAEDEVQLIEQDEVAAAFAKGMPLLEVGDYKIHASRREGPGMAEIHTRDTDIAYVLEGSATLVTGGTVLDARPTGPEELRGSGISRGQTRQLRAGDVVVIPNGVPHWFRNVTAPFLYYVIKVRQASRPAAIGAIR